MCHAYQWWVIVSKTVPSRSKTSPLARESISIAGDAASKHENFRSSDIDTMHRDLMFTSERPQFEEKFSGPSHDVDDSQQEQLRATTSDRIVLSTDDRVPQPGKAPEEECKIAEVQVMMCPDE